MLCSAQIALNSVSSLRFMVLPPLIFILGYNIKVYILYLKSIKLYRASVIMDLR